MTSGFLLAAFIGRGRHTHLLSGTAILPGVKMRETPERVLRGLGPSEPPQFQAQFPESLSWTLPEFSFTCAFLLLQSEPPLLSFRMLGAVKMPRALKRGKEMVKCRGGGGVGCG